VADKSRSSRISNFLFSEQFFPARPAELWSKASKITKKQFLSLRRLGVASASNAYYIRWLKQESMLQTSNKLASKYAGSGHMWRNPYAKPRPRAAISRASVWYTAYPISLITKEGESIIASLGNDDLWKAFEDIGIEGMHTGPMKLAGGIKGWNYTPSIDGHFDRISTKIDPLFGTEAEFKKMTRTAIEHNGEIIDDIVPGHTGKGADFRLAEMNYNDYPGIYHMVEIYQQDWNILPSVPDGKDSVNISQETEIELKRRGYIVGKLQRVIFYEQGVKETNWSVTKAVKGVDGIKRRWVYLHYFKEGQPSLNWLDPSFAGMKLVIGDALHSLEELGSGALRLDANGFLGVEVASEPHEAAWSEEHPLSETANSLIASMVRKVGGFTFQELNLSMDAIKTMGQTGADLSYDFINRPAYHHALATGNTEFLQLTLRSAMEMGIDPAGLVHAMQNHDELTYELVHFWTVHKDDIYRYQRKKITGLELRERIRNELKAKLSGENASYNLLFGENGIACTTLSVICGSLGYKDVTNLSQDNVDKISDAHLLLCMFNALQPGVFAISGWDLVGSLTLPKTLVADLLNDGDTRWINRGAYDLLGQNSATDKSKAGMPKAQSLYGSLAEQLADPDSFVHKLRTLLAIRKQYGIAVAKQLDIPNTSHTGTMSMLHALPQDNHYQMTVLNFTNTKAKTTIRSSKLPTDYFITNMFTQSNLGRINKKGRITLELGPYEGISLLFTQGNEK
jgi:trehalose synthase